MCHRECGFAISPKLVTDAGIVEAMSEAVRMVEHFGERNGLRDTLPCVLPFVRQLKGVAAQAVRANTGIMTAKLVTEVAVAGHVVKLHSIAGAVQRVLDIAPEKAVAHWQ